MRDLHALLPLATTSHDELAGLAARLHASCTRVFAKHGRPFEPDDMDVDDDARVCIRFERPWKDGTRAILLDPIDFIARLAALVLPPRVPLIHNIPRSPRRTPLGIDCGNVS